MPYKEVPQLYYRWVSMRNRCYRKERPDYRRYGARNIRVEWKSFSEFSKDMLPSFLYHTKKYSIQNTTLERIDNDKNYSKANCRWTTQLEQSTNRVNSRNYTYHGKTQTIASWARSVGMSRQALRYRLDRGLTIGKALSLKIDHTNKYAV